MSIASQRAHGPDFVISLLRGMVLGRFSFAAFCLALTVMLPRFEIAASFIGALLLSMVVQWATRAFACSLPGVEPRPAEPN
jgi:hypothetical protein